MIEPEIAFADLGDDADLAEDLLRYSFRAILDECGDDMAFFDERIEKGVIAKLQGIVDKAFVRMDYAEAIDILEKAGLNEDQFKKFIVKTVIDSLAKDFPEQIVEAVKDSFKEYNLSF